MATSRKCAFCGVGADLTNEHLFPSFLYRQSDPGQFVSVAKTAGGDKAVASELQIADVCSGCNNGPLSVLDQYAKQLHDDYFKTCVHEGDEIRFAFDFDLLLRWLLKVGYNFARARRWATAPDNTLVAYIIGRSPRPIGFRVFVQLIVPTLTTSIRWKEQPDAEEIPPAMARIELLDLRFLPGLSMAFKIWLGSYIFFVFKEDQCADTQSRKLALRNFIKRTPGCYELNKKRRALLYASSLDFMSAVAENAQFQDHLRLMNKHVEVLKERVARRRPVKGPKS